MASAFRASSSAIADTNSLSITLPASLQAGDVVLMNVGINVLDTISTPTGWTLLDSQAGASTRENLYGKVAGSTDAGATVTFTTPTALVKMSADCAAWSGGAATGTFHQVAGRLETTSQTTHTTPTITTTIDTCLIVQLVMVKSSSATSWTAPSGWTKRAEVYHTGAAPNGCIAGGGDHAAGTYGGDVFTSDVAGGQGAMWTVAIAPAVTVQVARPVSDVTTSGWSAVPALGGGVALATQLADDNDATYNLSGGSPSGLVREYRFAALTSLPSSWYARYGPVGGTPNSMTVLNQLVQGNADGSTTIIATRTETEILTGPKTYPYQLTAGEQALIDPARLSDLRGRNTFTVT
jgi:hypothetical protein